MRASPKASWLVGRSTQGQAAPSCRSREAIPDLDESQRLLALADWPRSGPWWLRHLRLVLGYLAAVDDLAAC